MNAPHRSILLILTGACLRAPAAFAGETPVFEWDESRDIAGQSDGGLIAVPDKAGGVYVLGGTPYFAGGEDLVVIRYDESGAEMWMEMYNGLGGNNHEFPYGAVVDDDGNLYVAAQSTDAAAPVSSEWATLKFRASDGFLLWERRFHGEGTFGQALPRAMAMGPDGRIVVAGWIPNDDSWVDFGVVVYGQDGSPLWDNSFSSTGYRADSAEGVAVGPDNSVVVVGQYVTPGNTMIGVVKFAADGAFAWSRTFDASAVADLEDRAHSVAIDGDGNIYVAGDGIDNFTDNRDFVLLKYAPDGMPLWDRRVVQPTSDISPTVLLAPNGTVLVSGIASPSYRVVAFDASGNPLWNRTHAGSISSEATRDHAALDASGNLSVLLRTVPTPGVGAFTIVRYSLDGDPLGDTVIDPMGTPRTPGGFAADSMGNLFATGWWIPGGSRDILTYAYSVATPGIPGDLDGDGDVDTTDLNILLSDFGCVASPCPGDADGDGDTDTTDLNILLSVFGT